MFTELPFDVVHQIASQLDISSYSSLGKTCHALHDQLKDDNTARPCIQRSIPHSTWGRLASLPSYKSGFRQLVDGFHHRTQSLQLASPYSVTTIGLATSFVYQSGILCYSDGDGVRILDFNSSRHTEKVLSSKFFSGGLAAKGTDEQTRGLNPELFKYVQVCSYADNIIACLCNFGAQGNYLFAVNIDEEFEPSVGLPDASCHNRILLCVRARSINKLFVRHDRQHLVYGTHSARGHHDHHEWLLEVYDLSTATTVSKEPLQLTNFYGSELASTVCFTVFEGSFYAVTNLTSLESEEVDWTSYYHFISFPLDEPSPDLRIQVIWRRQHVEGPINDAWTTLDFQQDHRTGELLIVECRKEWVNGGSRCIRSFYTQPFHRAQHQELKDGARHPPNDPLRRVLDKENNSRYEEPRPRARKYVHKEMDTTGCTKDYIRAKTKWNGYCFNAQSFVDIVTEEVKVDGEWRPRERIKLRVVSRNETSPLELDEEPRIPGGRVVRQRTKDRDKEEMLDGEEDFSPSHISLWPPNDAPQALHDILCPNGRAGDVKAVLGDEGLVYMAGPEVGGGRGERALVFVSFDPTFGFEGMNRLDGTSARGRQKSDVSTNVKKRRSISDAHEEKDHVVEVSASRKGKGKERDNSNLPENTKRLKIHELAESDCSSSCKAELSSSISSMAVLASTPAVWPPPLLAAVPDRTLHLPLPLQGGTTAESSSSRSHSRQTSDASTGANSSGTSLPSSTGLLTWRERAAYINIGRGIWTR